MSRVINAIIAGFCLFSALLPTEGSEVLTALCYAGALINALFALMPHDASR